MAEWAYVENNEIVELHDLLPISWRNISGLRNAADNIEFLNSVGWYKIQDQSESFNPNTHFINDYNYEFSNNNVRKIAILKEIVSPIEESFEYKKQVFLDKLRLERNKRLQDSDWTQLQDIQNKIDDPTRMNWINYRQQLRDIVAVYENTFVIEMDIILVTWPNQPSLTLNNEIDRIEFPGEDNNGE